ncbi:GTPase IMAP family member GIMD1-like [Chanos chanos]|uniref:GTPase IMAP family member GIMD1-like n=1 Tax=Chanos chanos TaxID=29144 RepID=A0A6J2VF73_CHACN|nr:GTPase IMAP family member GIMD1 [Chanos chanos]
MNLENQNGQLDEEDKPNNNERPNKDSKYARWSLYLRQIISGSQNTRTQQEVVTLNVLLVGGPQTGKSAVGNALLGSLEFSSSLSSRPVTLEPKLCSLSFPAFLRRQGKETALRLRVIDTPAIPNLALTEAEILQNVTTFMSHRSVESVDVLLLVLRADVPLGREVENQLNHTLEVLLGPSWNSHSMIILTHKDQLRGSKLSQTQFLQRGSSVTQRLVEKVENRVYFADVSTKHVWQEGTKLRESILQLTVRNKYSSLQLKQVTIP